MVRCGWQPLLPAPLPIPRSPAASAGASSRHHPPPQPLAAARFRSARIHLGLRQALALHFFTTDFRATDCRRLAVADTIAMRRMPVSPKFAQSLSAASLGSRSCNPTQPTRFAIPGDNKDQAPAFASSRSTCWRIPPQRRSARATGRVRPGRPPSTRARAPNPAVSPKSAARPAAPRLLSKAHKHFGGGGGYCISRRTPREWRNSAGQPIMGKSADSQLAFVQGASLVENGGVDLSEKGGFQVRHILGEDAWARSGGKP